MTQVGYGAGLLLVVPLGDLVENRRLVISVVLLAALALTAALFAHHAATFLAAALGIGFGSVAVQILVPYAAHLAPPAARPGGGHGDERPDAGHHAGTAGGQRAHRGVRLAGGVRALGAADGGVEPGAGAGNADAPAASRPWLWRPVAVHGLAAAPHPDPAPAGPVSGLPVRCLQSVLDRGAAAAGEPGVRFQPGRHRPVRSGRRGRGGGGAHRRAPGGPGLHPSGHGFRHADFQRRLRADAAGGAGLDPGGGVAGDRGGGAGFWRVRQCGARPARHLRPGRHLPGPPQRPLHGDFLHRWRPGVRRGRLVPGPWWLVADRHHRRVAAAGGAGLFPHGAGAGVPEPAWLDGEA